MPCELPNQTKLHDTHGNWKAKWNKRAIKEQNKTEDAQKETQRREMQGE